MAAKQLKDSGENRPRKKVRAGRFQISTWVFRRLVPHGDKDATTYLEQWVDVERACIQYSRYDRKRRRWDNRRIWCSWDDLRDLAKVVDELNEAEVSSHEEASSSSPKASKRNKGKGMISPIRRGEILPEEGR